MYRREKRLVINVSEELHYALKMEALQKKITIKTLLLERLGLKDDINKN